MALTVAEQKPPHLGGDAVVDSLAAVGRAIVGMTAHGVAEALGLSPANRTSTVYGSR